MTSPLGFAEVFRAIVIRRHLVVLLTLLFFALFVAAAFLLQPRYGSSALLEILPAGKESPLDDHLPSLPDDVITISTESSKLTSEQIARAVFADVKDEYAELAWRAPGPLGAGRTLSAMLAAAFPPTDEALFRKFWKNVSAEVVRGTRLINISFTAPDPVFAAKVANMFAGEYLRRKDEEKAAFRAQFTDWLDRRLAELRGQVHAADQAVAQYRGETKLIEMGKEIDQARRSPVVEELGGMLARLGDAKAAQATAEARLARLERMRGNPDAVASAPEVMGSPLMHDLMKAEAEARRRLADLNATYGKKHPLIIGTQAELAEQQTKIAQEIARTIAAAEQDYQLASATVGQLDTEVAGLQQRAVAEQRDRIKLRELEREADAGSELYNTYLTLTREVTQRADWNPSHVTLVAEAMPPDRPSFPQKRLMLPLGLVASASLSMLIGTAVELRRRHRVFVDPREAELATGLPVIGVLPRARRPTDIANSTNGYALALEDLALRLRRGSDAGKPEAPCVVAVVSAAPDEGKSALTIALARWLVANGERVLIVDGDLRQPSIRRLAGSTGGDRDGRGGAGTSGVDIMSPEGTSPSAWEVLATVPRLLDGAKASYDAILVDMPPLLAVSDAVTMARHCDQVLFVVRWAWTPKDSVEFALRQLEQGTRSRTSLVFSMVEQARYKAYGVPGSERFRYGIGKRYKALALGPPGDPAASEPGTRRHP